MPGVQRLHVRFRDAGKNATVWAFDAHVLLRNVHESLLHLSALPQISWVISPSTFRMLDAILADERQKKNAEEEDKEDNKETKEQKQQKVKCNDCGEVTMAEFHFVYHACGKCRSYNTVVE